MASVKVVLRKKKNSKGEYPLVIRITKDRKTSYIYTGKYILEDDWDFPNQRVKKAHPNSKRLNNFLLKKLANVNDEFLKLESDNKIHSAKGFNKQLKQKNLEDSFFALADKHLNYLEKTGKITRVKAERSRVNHFKNFLDGNDIPFKEITEDLLKRFRAYLRGDKELMERSVVNNMIVIRTLFNQAIRDGIVDQRFYPFGKGKIQLKFPESIKIGLTIDEVRDIEDLDLKFDSPIWHTRNVWLFSFYFAGMRVSDVLRVKWSDFNDNRLYYTMGKNQKVGSLKTPEKVQSILKNYISDKKAEDDFVFPELKKADTESPEDMARKITTAVKYFNKYLGRIATQAKIEKKLTMHIARHTFGNISGDKIPIQMLQKLYRHTSISTTINYQGNFLFQDADEALDAVINSD